jgi:hypothetical protein
VNDFVNSRRKFLKAVAASGAGFGGVLACMLAGFRVFEKGGALPIDWIGNSIMNAAALM